MKNIFYISTIFTSVLISFCIMAMEENAKSTNTEEKKLSSLRRPTVAIVMDGKVCVVEVNHTLMDNRCYPLHFIATLDDPKNLIGHLINKGAIVDILDIEGLTPLHYAVQHKQYKNARVLLENHANPNVTDSLGLTPLDCAYFNNDTEMSSLLSQYHAQHGMHNLIDLKEKLTVVKNLDPHIIEQFHMLTQKTRNCKTYEEFQEARAKLIDFCKQHNLTLTNDQQE